MAEQEAVTAADLVRRLEAEAAGHPEGSLRRMRLDAAVRLVRGSRGR